MHRQRGRPRMTKNAQRLSQVVSTFGPGAMVDLPTRSVLVGGLDLWEMRGDAFTTIPEPRIALRLEKLLKQQGRLEQSKSLSLRTPPVDEARPGRLPSYIVAPVFPAYFVCEHVEIVTVDGKPARRRRLVRWQDLDPRGGRRKFVYRRRHQIRCDADPLRVCLREGPPAGHQLEMGRARQQRSVPGADVDRREGHQRRPCRHDGGLWLRQAAFSAGIVPGGTNGQLPR